MGKKVMTTDSDQGGRQWNYKNGWLNSEKKGGYHRRFWLRNSTYLAKPSPRSS